MAGRLQSGGAAGFGEVVLQSVDLHSKPNEVHKKTATVFVAVPGLAAGLPSYSALADFSRTMPSLSMSS